MNHGLIGLAALLTACATAPDPAAEARRQADAAMVGRSVKPDPRSRERSESRFETAVAGLRADRAPQARFCREETFSEAFAARDAYAAALDQWVPETSYERRLRPAALEDLATAEVRLAALAQERGCGGLARGLFLRVIETYTGSNFAAQRQRAQIGIDDLRRGR